MEPTSFHSGPNTIRGQIHGAAGGGDDTKACREPAFLMSSIILQLHTWIFLVGQSFSVMATAKKSFGDMIRNL